MKNKIFILCLGMFLISFISANIITIENEVIEDEINNTIININNIDYHHVGENIEKMKNLYVLVIIISSICILLSSVFILIKNRKKIERR